VAVIRIGVLGVPGRMAREVMIAILARGDLSLGAAVARPGSPHVGEDAGTIVGGPRCGIGVTDDPRALAEVDVVVDFSTPAALAAALPAIPGRPLVSGTTGLDPATRALRDAHAKTAPLLAAANFSVGIAVLRDLVRRSAAALPDAEVEIVEAHHRHKKDAPSGTALALGALRAARWIHGRPPGAYDLAAVLGLE
jgi:4-hydroxy-tetrahydrodipicolinate reductase